MMTSRSNAELAFVLPALPTLVAASPSGGEWRHEVKHDGYRAITVVEDGRARIWATRTHIAGSRLAFEDSRPQITEYTGSHAPKLPVVE
jgi:bifunctional non-homologous end joining protein LigD